MTTDELTELNRAVDLEGRPAAGVARDWLRARGLADG
jgi:glycine betaine/choline ABC-type transport system substrate-binding protein